MATTPDDKIVTNEDYDNNAQIMHSANPLRINNDESETKPKAIRSWKWNSLTLIRKTDDDAILRAAAANAGKGSLYRISWFMPHVIPADAEKFSIYKTIE